MAGGLNPSEWDDLLGPFEDGWKTASAEERKSLEERGFYQCQAGVMMAWLGWQVWVGETHEPWLEQICFDAFAVEEEEEGCFCSGYSAGLSS